MANIRFFLQKPDRFGKKQVYMDFTWQNERLRLYTGLKALPTDWHDKKGEWKPTSPANVDMNRHLNMLREKAMSTFLRLSETGTMPSLAEMRDELSFQEKRQTEALSVIEAFEEYIQEHKGVKKLMTTKNQQTALKHLRDFESVTRRRITWKGLDATFYNRFVSYLQEKDPPLALNSIGGIIKKLKAFFRYANRKGWLTKIDFSEFKGMEEESQAIYLNLDELKILADLDLKTQPALDRVRDLFLVGAFTGLRFSDFSRISPDHIQGGLLKIKTEKTGEHVTVPLHPIVTAILEKYENVLPPAFSNQKMNQRLKELAKLAEFKDIHLKTITKGGKRESTSHQKWQLVSTHTARRSFATNLYNQGFPSMLIMKITGHKTERAFMKYIKISQEEAARKLMEFWGKGKN